MTARSAQPRTLRARIVTSNESSLEVLADLVASADALRAEADALRARLSPASSSPSPRPRGT